MKIDARKVASVLQDANKFRVFLIYGENTGLVRERATRLVHKIAGTTDDPFRNVILDKDSHDRLIEEATALSLIGGQRAVWIREGGDHLGKILDSFCQNHLHDENAAPLDSTIIIEAGNLSPRSSLRSVVEKHPLMAAIPCYAETGRNLEETVKMLLGRKRIAPDAFRYLLAILGTDRALIRNEMEKLLLFVGEQSQITMDDIEQAIGDSNEYSVDDILYAAMSGQIAATDRSLSRGLKEGLALIAIIRGLLYFVDRLIQVKLMIRDEGLPLKNAVGKLNPPVFFKRMDGFLKALEFWNLDQLTTLSRQVQHLEYLSKQSAIPVETLCRHFILALAMHVKEKKMAVTLNSLFSNL